MLRSPQQSPLWQSEELIRSGPQSCLRCDAEVATAVALVAVGGVGVVLSPVLGCDAEVASAVALLAVGGVESERSPVLSEDVMLRSPQQSPFWQSEEVNIVSDGWVHRIRLGCDAEVATPPNNIVLMVGPVLGCDAEVAQQSPLWQSEEVNIVSDGWVHRELSRSGPQSCLRISRPSGSRRRSISFLMVGVSIVESERSPVLSEDVMLRAPQQSPFWQSEEVNIVPDGWVHR
ncbi:hypothetical protein J6590_091935 [Homalodisca vitripennis]|nr:hypothetical protein J6590_091935 [Homalodisca vitripennis]